ncbi:hypothetical protein BDR06DRAFT_976176 [Suillus hirtellus]|nr:hypothetical protein BDR06DRAFT_976176 [Suillus hirtellus]
MSTTTKLKACTIIFNTYSLFTHCTHHYFPTALTLYPYMVYLMNNSNLRLDNNQSKGSMKAAGVKVLEPQRIRPPMAQPRVDGACTEYLLTSSAAAVDAVKLHCDTLEEGLTLMDNSIDKYFKCLQHYQLYDVKEVPTLKLESHNYKLPSWVVANVNAKISTKTVFHVSESTVAHTSHALPLASKTSMGEFNFDFDSCIPDGNFNDPAYENHLAKTALVPKKHDHAMAQWVNKSLDLKAMVIIFPVRLVTDIMPEYHCKDCFGTELYCKDCMVERNHNNPLHRIKMLTFKSKASAFKYWQTAAHLTDNTGIKPCKVRYESLLCMIKQWWNIMLLKYFSQGHDPAGVDTTEPGQCAVFCPTCPHSGKNLPENWKMVSPDKQWLYAQYLAIDTNCRLVWKNVSSDSVNPGLSKGWAYFVKETSFKLLLKDVRKVSQEKSTCVSHNTMNLGETKNL